MQSTPARSRWLTRLKFGITRWLAPALVGTACTAVLATPPRDRLTLLVPDDASVTAWQVQVWTDSAAEEGIRLELITDSDFLALGRNAAARISGLIVPDSAHVRASDAVVAAVKQYAYLGGKLMLVYDAGAQTEAGFYPLSGPSRFSDMVGVNYVNWDNGNGAATMVGFGPVVGTRARLDALSFPPGKYAPYVPAASVAGATMANFVPTTVADPGATQAMRETVRRRGRAIDDGSASVRRLRYRALRDVLGIGVESSAALRLGWRNGAATPAMGYLNYDRWLRGNDDVEAVLSADGTSAIERSVGSTATDATLQAISGYAYGPLGYFHYVTVGQFPGTVYLSSPDHGVVAGKRAYGSGQVLFVNIPLGYFKALGTDSAPLHGFLGQFARDEVGIATLSAQPRGRGGLIYNWHIDDGDDLLTDTKNLLNNTRVLRRGPFSIHLTAGPDVINVGDGNGMDLDGNAQSREMLRRIANVGRYAYSLPVSHEIGSHGGWIHDYWGAFANEANTPDLTPLLVKNFDAIERVTGRRIREYSAPTGNNPTWALRWLEQRGVVAFYTVGDGGAGAVRPWRDGARLTQAMWAIPVTPNGKYATFEEFDEFGISDRQSAQWLIDLQSFVVNHRTNRMFYNHPPGAAAHLKPVNVVLNRGDSLEDRNRFRWYSMTQVADFSQRRLQTTWSTSNVGLLSTITATNPQGLDDVTWLLPKKRYTLPWVIYGRGSVGWDSDNWIVTGEGGTTLKFLTYPL